MVAGCHFRGRGALRHEAFAARVHDALASSSSAGSATSGCQPRRYRPMVCQLGVALPPSGRVPPPVSGAAATSVSPRLGFALAPRQVAAGLGEGRLVRCVIAALDRGLGAHWRLVARRL